MQLRVIVPDLVARIEEELAENHRWPRTMQVKWRHRGAGYFPRASASAPLAGAFKPAVGTAALVRFSLVYPLPRAHF